MRRPRFVGAVATAVSLAAIMAAGGFAVVRVLNAVQGTTTGTASASTTPGVVSLDGSPDGAPGSSTPKASSPAAMPSGIFVPAGSAAAPTVAGTAVATAAAARRSVGRCGRAASSSPAVRVSQVALGSSVAGYGGEGDTDPLPTAIAATPSGQSWLAWLGSDGKVHLGRLDCDDKLVGKPTTFSGIDLQDVAADADGGVLLLTRPAAQGSGTLCGGSSSPVRAMFMVRFDNSGKQVWERQVTNLTGGRGGYDDGARFVWWYQHHGRLAYDGTNYAAYFGVAITVANGSCVDVHEGDRMQVVSPSGALLSGHDSFEVGCSHAWTSRIAWDPRTRHFAMACATDNDCRIAQPNPYRTVAAGTCDGTLFGGDLVLARGSGYWTAWSQGGTARLSRFAGSAAASRTITTAASTSHPHLVTYGGGRMLLTWESGSRTAARVYDASTGSTVGSQFAIGVRDHSYAAFKAYADGSVAYPAAGSTTSSVTIARVMPLA